MLDIGCGSLRAGRLFIPYLRESRYFGIEPNRWLVEEGIKENVGDDLVALKRPSFSFRDDFSAAEFDVQFDYVIAQSIFSHCGPDMISKCFHAVAQVLKPDGIMAVNFSECAWPAESNAEPGWIYPTNVSYRAATVRKLAADAGLVAVRIPWKHAGELVWLGLSFDKSRLPTLAERRKLTGATVSRPRESFRGRARYSAGFEVKKRLDPPALVASPLALHTRSVVSRRRGVARPSSTAEIAASWPPQGERRTKWPTCSPSPLRHEVRTPAVVPAIVRRRPASSLLQFGQMDRANPSGRLYSADECRPDGSDLDAIRA